MRAAAVGALFRLGEPAAIEGIRRLAHETPCWVPQNVDAQLSRASLRFPFSDRRNA